MLGKIRGITPCFIFYCWLHMGLCRIKTVEKLRGRAPGEFGKLLGLDRIPEVRCLRNKLDELSAGGAADCWAAHLSRHWMEGDTEAVGTLYVDGHVRVYHGRLTKLPRRYVSRERLCLRGTTGYFVNDATGRPFFVVEKALDSSLLGTLRKDIVPRLLRDVPGQPSDSELSADLYLCRFTLVFDREGYSPEFFQEMWQTHRIACSTYHKHPGASWPEEWFSEYEEKMPGGELVKLSLCEMGSLVGSGKDRIWMREVRKLTQSGHQTSIISTAFNLPMPQLSVRMFSRWCQENFFRYMMQHFDIDMVIEYGTMEFPDTGMVVNPAWRKMNRSQNSLVNMLRYRRARFAEMTMHPETDDNPERYMKWLNKKSDLLEEIENYEHQLKELKATLKDTPKRIRWEQLEEKDRFRRLLPGRRRLMDTVRMIAYRAETAMVGLLKGPTVNSSDARTILQDLFVTEADIIPNIESKQLHVRVHCASRPVTNQHLEKLFSQLNEAEVLYPGTDMCIVYELRVNSSQKSGVGVT